MTTETTTPTGTETQTTQTTQTTQPVQTVQTVPTNTVTPAATVDKPAGDYTGSSLIDTSIAIFEATHGVSGDKFADAIAGALKHNDESLINLDALTAGLKPDAAAQAKALATAAFKEAQAVHTRTTEAAYTLAGGKDQWDAAVAAFNTNAPAHIKAVVQTMLNGHDVQNAAKFVLETVRGSGMVNHGTPPQHGGTGGAPTQGLSYPEFREALGKLEREAGNNSFEQGAFGVRYQNLLAQRELGRKQGI